VVHHARTKPAEQIRQAAPELAANGENYGLRWIDLSNPTFKPHLPPAYRIEAARSIEAEALRLGMVAHDVFDRYARRDLRATPIVALTLSPLPQSWNAPKSEPLRPSLLAQLVQIILEHFPPKPTPNRPFNFG
jgi:hypothetical protein